MTDNDDAQRRASDAFEQQRKIQLLSHPARQFEIGLDVNVRKTVPVAQYELRIVHAELFGVPVLDEAVEHVKVVREIDDAGRIAVREPNGYRARKGALWRNKPTFFHMIFPQPSSRAHPRTLAFGRHVSAPTILRRWTQENPRAVGRRGDKLLGVLNEETDLISGAVASENNTTAPIGRQG